MYFLADYTAFNSMKLMLILQKLRLTLTFTVGAVLGTGRNLGTLC